MHRKSIRRAALGAAALLLSAVAGCGPAPVDNSSPTAESDPARYNRAVSEAEAKARKDQEDERKAFQAKGRQAPNP